MTPRNAAQCEGKARLTREIANMVKRRMRGKGRKIGAYWCDNCGGYHLGGND